MPGRHGRRRGVLSLMARDPGSPGLALDHDQVHCAALGVEDYALRNGEEGGSITAQAGVHGFEQTTTIALNQQVDTKPLETPPELRRKRARRGWPRI